MTGQAPKSTKKTLAVAAALVATLAVSGVAVAGGKNCGGRGGHHGEMGGKHLQRLSDKLELSEDQQSQVETIMQANRERRQQQHEQNREALKTELAGVLSAEQLEQFEAMMEKRKRKMDRHMRDGDDS